jgi:hypothetical protein|nr:MAG TPA: hypothetical protein [Caudoviricetes sp.]
MKNNYDLENEFSLEYRNRPGDNEFNFNLNLDEDEDPEKDIRLTVDRDGWIDKEEMMELIEDTHPNMYSDQKIESIATEVQYALSEMIDDYYDEPTDDQIDIDLDDFFEDDDEEEDDLDDYADILDEEEEEDD